MERKKKLMQDFLENNLDKEGQKAFFKALDNREILNDLEHAFDQDIESGQAFDDERIAPLDSAQTFSRIKAEISHLERRSIRTTVLKIAAAILLPILVANVGLWFYFKYQQPTILWSEIYVPKGEKAQFIFQDGTRVWLNAGTKLTYPINFVGQMRQVKLDGEGYFVVHKNPDKPFMVEINKLTIKITGTSFNINGYSGASKIVTTLDEGKIVLLLANKTEQQLLPGDEATFDCATGNVAVEKVPISTNPAWQEDQLRFDNITLEEVTQMLERKYDVTIQINGDKIKGYKYHLKFEKATIEEVFEALQLITPIKIEKKDTTYVISQVA